MVGRRDEVHNKRYRSSRLATGGMKGATAMSKRTTLTKGEWAKHLKPFGKRVFWKKERANAKRDVTRARKGALRVGTV